MEKFSKYAVWALLALAPVVVSCSDDDEPKQPSREIAKVRVYKAANVDYSLNMMAEFKFSYDGKGRVEKVTTNYKAQEVNYDYETNLVKYSWLGSDQAQGGTFVNRFEAALRNGRVQAASLVHTAGMNMDSTYVYNYHYTNDGYIEDATFGSSLLLSYNWGNASLTIKGNTSKYDEQYGYSFVLNNYSVNLNALPMLVDLRANVALELNVYAQLADMLGTRYPMFLEDKDYAYTYYFDGEGRLVQIVQEPASLLPSKQDTYWFMMSYSE